MSYDDDIPDRMSARSQGRRAYRSGRSPSANPYNDGSYEPNYERAQAMRDAYDGWRAGWRAAQEEEPLEEEQGPWW